MDHRLLFWDRADMRHTFEGQLRTAANGSRALLRFFLATKTIPIVFHIYAMHCTTCVCMCWGVFFSPPSIGWGRRCGREGQNQPGGDAVTCIEM